MRKKILNMARLIYLDNAATTLRKPPTVAKTVARAIASGEIGNAGRSSYSAAYTAANHCKIIQYKKSIECGSLPKWKCSS